MSGITPGKTVPGRTPEGRFANSGRTHTAATWWNEYPYKEEAQAGGATYKKFLEFLIKPLVERPRGSQVAQDDESSQSGNDKRALARVERTPATSPDQHDAGSPSGTDTAQLGDRVHSK